MNTCKWCDVKFTDTNPDEDECQTCRLPVCEVCEQVMEPGETLDDITHIGCESDDDDEW